MEFWFTADYHLGHANIIKYCNRPFRDLKHMNESIIRNHNSRVKPEDIVFHIGDFCFRNSSSVRGEGKRKSSSDWEKELSGKIIHIRGNHDNNNSTKTIITGLLIEHCGWEIYCVHNPEHYNERYSINFVGHVHDHWRRKKVNDITLFNVGVDVNGFMPRTLTEIMSKKG